MTPSHAARLGEAAALSGLSLSNYIRRRLSADDTLQEELTLLRQIVADLGHLRDTRQAAIETAHVVASRFSSSDLNNTNWSRSQMASASFEGVKLTGATFSEARSLGLSLRDSLLVGADLRGGKFRKQRLVGIDFSPQCITQWQ